MCACKGTQQHWRNRRVWSTRRKFSSCRNSGRKRCCSICERRSRRGIGVRSRPNSYPCIWSNRGSDCSSYRSQYACHRIIRRGYQTNDGIWSDGSCYCRRSGGGRHVRSNTWEQLLINAAGNTTIALAVGNDPITAMIGSVGNTVSAGLNNQPVIAQQLSHAVAGAVIAEIEGKNPLVGAVKHLANSAISSEIASTIHSLQTEKKSFTEKLDAMDAKISQLNNDEKNLIYRPQKEIHKLFLQTTTCYWKATCWSDSTY